MKLLLNPTRLTCQITIGNWPAAKGIQKLTGFTRGLGFHRVDYFPYWHISNSIVLGYNRSENEDTVRVWMYGYLNGKHFQTQIAEVKPKDKIEPILRWEQRLLGISAIVMKDGVNIGAEYKHWHKTLPIGFLLNPYAEIDGKENKRTPFLVDIKNLKVNGKLIRI